MIRNLPTAQSAHLPRARVLGLISALTTLPLLALTGCGDSTPSGEADPGGARFNPNGATEIHLDGAAPVAGTPGAGVLEVLNPELPERPLYKEFGDVAFGTVLYWTMEMRNVGTAPVNINTAQAACGCTRFMDFTVTDASGSAPARPTAFTAQAEGALATIPAGGTILMRMKLMSEFSTPNERKLAMMRLSTDSVIKPFLTFEVGFQPTRAFIFAPDRANLLNSPFSSGREKRIKILVDRAGDPERVLGVLSKPEGIEAELITETFAGEYVWYVNVSVPPLSALGTIRGDVILKTTDAEGNGDAGRLKLPVVALVVADVISTPNLAPLRAFDRSVGAEFTGRIVALVPGARLMVMGTRVESEHAEHFSIEATPIKAFQDGRAIEWSYTVKVGPGHPQGFVAGELIFELEEAFGGLPDDVPANELRVRLSGIARDPQSDKAN